MGALELHIWGAHVEDAREARPPGVRLRPRRGGDFATVKASATEMRDRLKSLGLTSFAMATGGKGIHVVVPLTPQHGWDDIKAFAEAMARTLAAEDPDRYLAEVSKKAAQGPHLHRLSAQRPRRDGDRAVFDAGAERRAGRLARRMERAAEARTSAHEVTCQGSGGRPEGAEEGSLGRAISTSTRCCRSTSSAGDGHCGRALVAIRVGEAGVRDGVDFGAADEPKPAGRPR